MRFLLNSCLVAMVVAIPPALTEQDAIRAETPIPAAEATPPAPAPEVPPSRVGRLSLVSGNASRRASGETGWTDAAPNEPVLIGELLRTGPQTRAEIQVGADTIDLSGGTELEIVNLSDLVIQIAVSRGRLNLHPRQVREGESVEIDTPRGGVWLLGSGYYDIDAGNGDQPSRVAVFEGTARVVVGDRDASIEAGNMVVLTTSGPAAATIEPAAPDAFVEWCRARDYDETGLAAPYYISSYVTGIAELDAAGSWKLTSESGAVWVPNEVPADWAPYRYGHWSWMAPWGWTWIDDQPWGFAPFHYGRWAVIDQRWAWVPGSFVAHPLYMPAVVAFLGTPGVGLSFAEGAAVGWFPLAPGEAYWPTYSRDLGYVRSLNLGNIEDADAIRMQADGEPPLEVVNKDFANRQFASVVPRPVFINGRAVAPALLTLPEQRLQDAPVLMGSPQIAPPSAQRVAHVATTTVQTGRKNAPPGRQAVGISRKGGARLIRTAAMSRGNEQPVLIRGAHLHAPSYAGLSRLRQVIVLRAAHSPKGGARKGARR